jgi:hypothetical protein
MRTVRGTTATVAAATLLALPLAGCGKDKPKIPRSDAQAIVALLRSADARAAAKACTGLQKVTVPELDARLSALPPNTDPDIRDSLRQGVDNLRNLIAIQCSTVKPKPQQTTTTTTPSTTQSTTQPATTQQTTTTQPTTTTQTTTTQPPTQPPTSPSGGSPPPKGKKAKGKAGK